MVVLSRNKMLSYGRGQLLLLLAASTQAGGKGPSPPQCSMATFAAATINNTACVVFPDLAALPVGVWPVHSHAPPLTVFVATPCHNVTAAQTTCTTFVSATAAPAFQQSVTGPSQVSPKPVRIRHD